jgi:hypothetical protein
MVEQKCCKNLNLYIIILSKVQTLRKSSDRSLEEMLRNVIILTSLKSNHLKSHYLVRAEGLKTIFFSDWNHLNRSNTNRFPGSKN